ELLIAGVGVAGYLRRPDLDAAKFLHLELSDGFKSLVFVTGDRIRHTAAGELEFLGRKDHQVKLRGFRVELGEVESKLAEHPEVATAVVLLSEHGDSPELWAFVATASRASMQGYQSTLRSSLRNRCAEELPSHAIPQRLAILDGLPLLPSGKIDRQKLLAGPPPPPLADATAKISLTEVEGSLRQTVAELVERATGVAVEDSEELTALGIDSVSAVPLAELLSTSILHGAAVPLEDLYVYSTMASLCVYLEGRLEDIGTSKRSSTGRRYAEIKKGRAQNSAGAGHSAKAVKMHPGLEACRAGDASALKAELASGSFDAASTLDRFGGSGLHWAASGGHLE
ncbi:lgrB, partial [Symbiodinium sp. CCMP2592]